MRIKYYSILMGWLIISVFLSGCTSEHIESNIRPQFSDKLNADRISITESTDGRVLTSLEMVTELTPYSKAEGIQYHTAPLFSASDEEVYLIRNFPSYVDTNDEVLAFAEKREWLTDIEVYKKDDFNEPIRIINTEGLEGMIYTDLHCDMNGNLTIVGYMGNTYYFRVLDADGKLIHTADVSGLEKYHINIPIAGSGTFYFINESNNDMYMFRREFSECECVAENVLAMDMYKDVVYYITKGYSESFEYVMQLYALNPSTSEHTLLGETKTTDHVNSMVYDPENQILYLADYDDIGAYSLKENTKIPVMVAFDSSISLKGICKDRLFIGNDQHQIIVYELPSVPQEIQHQKYVINVCDFVGHPDEVNSRFAPALRAMQKDGITVELNTVYYSPDSAEYNNTMAKKILANDTDFDLFYLADYTPDLFEEQICFDLTEYPLLEGYYDRMHPAVREICTIGQTTLLFPMDLYQYVMIENCSSVNTTVTELPVNLSDLNEFYQAVEPVLTEGSWFTTAYGIRQLADPWLDQFNANFMAKQISDEDALRELTTLFETIVSLSKKERVKTGLNIQGEKFLAFEKCWLISDDADAEMIHDLPKLNNQFQDCVGGSYYAVNKNSKNPDVTALLIAYYMEYYNDRLLYSGTPQTENEIEMLERLQNSLRRAELPGFAEDMHYRFTDMLNGMLFPEDAAEETLRYLKMIRDE